MRPPRSLTLTLTGLLLLLAGCGGGHTVTHKVSPCPNGPLYRPCGPHVKGFAVPPVNRQALPPVRGVATREMYDSITVATVPANPWAVAGYTSGFWPTAGPLARAFPNAHHLSIAINAGHDADCLDVEPLDAVPAQAGTWARRQLTLHHAIVCLYASLSTMPTVKAYVTRAGIALSRVRFWCAWYRYIPGLVQGCDAVQWTDHALNRNLDQSTVRADFFGPPPVDPYAKYPPQVRTFQVGHGTVRASERNTVLTWDHAHCRQPARRQVCTSSADHLSLLLGRINFLRFHVLTAHGWQLVLKARDSTDQLGSRAAGIRGRLQ